VTAPSPVAGVDRSVRAQAAPTVVRQLRVAQVVTKLTAGAGGITLRGALALDRDRYSTTVLAARGGSLIDRAEAVGLPVIRLRHMAPGRGIYPWTDLQGLRELTTQLSDGDFDLVHTHSSKAGALGRVAARRAGVPAVVHSFHGFPFHEFQPAILRRSLVAVERRLAGITDYFLTDGTFVAAEAVRLKIASPERIRAIASPVDDGIPLVSEIARRQARGLLGIPSDARVVGTAARLDAQKSPADMVEAIAALQRPDVYMVWIGDGELRTRIERLVARNGIGDRFLLLGDRMDVSRLLPGFDVFAMSSLYEGLPCALVEAMTCGVPVVATAVNSVPEIVIPGKTGLLARPRDPASLSRALAYLLDHPAQAARMADAARTHIGDRFRPDVVGKDLMEAYERAVCLAFDRVAGFWPRGRA
jgi:glycosyltransferase involved in cell wall biosynthesis